MLYLPIAIGMSYSRLHLRLQRVGPPSQQDFLFKRTAKLIPFAKNPNQALSVKCFLSLGWLNLS